MHAFITILLDAALKSTVLLSLAWIAGLACRNRSASSRHTLRICTLGACLLLPVFSVLLPSWHVSIVRNVSAPVVIETAHPDLNLASKPPSSIEHRQAPRLRASEAPAPSAIARAFSAAPWQLLLLSMWFLGAMVFMLRMLAGRARLNMLLRRSVSMDDPDWNAQTKSRAESMGIRRAITLLASHDTDVPLSTGAWRPKVILSPDFEEWSLLRRNAILCHELAHIKRLDTVSLAVAQIGLSVYWFHPLVWITVRALREDRERACDDYVLATGTRPSEYARELLEIASSLRLPDFTAALAMARRSELEGRVMAILNPKLNRGEISRKTTMIVAIITLAIVLPVAAMRPQSASTASPQKAPASQPAAQPSPRSGAPAVQQEPAEERENESIAERQEEMDSRSSTQARDSNVLAKELAKQAAELARLAKHAKTDAYAAQIAELRAMAAQISAQKDSQRAAQADQLAALAELKKQTDTNPKKLAELSAQMARLSSLNLAETEAGKKALADQIAALAKLKAVPWVSSGELAQLRAQYATLQAALDGFNPDHRPVFTNECIAGKSVKYNLQKNFDGQQRNQIVTWSGDGCNASLHIDGIVTLDADGGQIESLSEGGSIEVKEQRGQTVRELRVTPSPSGLKYVMKVNGRENPFDEEAKAWLAEFLRAFDQYSANC